MKSLKLVIIFGFIVSCTPNINTLPNPNKTSSPSPKASNLLNPNASQSVSPKPTDFPTITPSITVSTPTPMPSSSNNPITYPIANGLLSRIYSLDDNITFANSSGTYKMVINEKRRFSAEIYIDGIVYNDISFESSNPSILSIDSNGVATTFSGTGDVVLKAVSNKLRLSTSLKIQVVETLVSKKLGYDKDCNNIYVDYTLNRAENPFVPIDYRGDDVIADLRERPTFSGKVYDLNGNPVEKVIVSARAIDSGVNWVGEAQETISGVYVFRNAPIGTKILITVTKDGWTTRTRTVVLGSNLKGEPCVNNFNFRGIYSIQDEPEIVSLKINGKQVNSSSNEDIFNESTNRPKNLKPSSFLLDNANQVDTFGNVPSLTGLNSNTLEVEMTFSEPIKVDDVRNYFRIISQSTFNNKFGSFTIDGNYSGTEFLVSADEKTITFKTNKALLANKEGQEARYLIDFSQAFRDKTDKAAIDRRYIRFSPTQMNDFAVFSVKNDETSPKLLGITARDGGSGNDTIELRYSEPMELINQKSYTAGLIDSTEPLNLNRQLWYRDANNVKANSNPIANSIEDNNATLVGFLSGSDTDTSRFKASYMIGRIISSEISSTTTSTVKTSILGNKNRTPNTSPVKGNTIANNLLRNVRITGSNVLLEFSPDAFDRDDRIIVSVGKGIEGSFVDRNRTPSLNDELRVNTIVPSFEYATIYDPAGRLIDSGDSTTSANIDVNNSQRVATAS